MHFTFSGYSSTPPTHPIYLDWKTWFSFLEKNTYLVLFAGAANLCFTASIVLFTLLYAGVFSSATASSLRWGWPELHTTFTVSVSLLKGTMRLAVLIFNPFPSNSFNSVCPFHFNVAKTPRSSVIKGRSCLQAYNLIQGGTRWGGRGEKRREQARQNEVICLKVAPGWDHTVLVTAP